MNNKKTISSVAALLILIFHFLIYITNSQIEIFARKLCIVGVDLFFFISVYGLNQKREIKYKDFIKNRFKFVYIKYILLSITMAVISIWSFQKVFSTILGIDLFINGGGSFLWFIPSIMIVYLLFPLYKKADNYSPKLTLLFTIVLYLFLSICISVFTTYNEIFIFTNRIPIMLIAFYTSKYNLIEKIDNNIKYWAIPIILLIIGLIISYYTIMNNVSLDILYDSMYIFNIPFTLGLILLLNKIKENRITKIIGSCTLEIYGVQMIFGYKIVNRLYLFIKNAILTNIFSMIILIFISIMINMIFNIFVKKVLKEG